MQFHLDGFMLGDPALKLPAIGLAEARPCGPLPAAVDVLIVGSGPTGLTLATQLAAFPGISTLLVEQKTERLSLGQADGIACRTMEMFEAFGFSERVLKEACWVNETTFWKPDDENQDIIVRSGRIQDTEDGLSEFPHVILNQARVHDFYLGTMCNSPTRLVPAYGRSFVNLTREQDDSELSHPLTIQFRNHCGEIEEVRARYVVGCDGARSGVRKALGLELRGDSANQAWGVMDVLAVSDFPDVRLKSVIQSAAEGSVLIIPREGGYLVRLYIELDKLNANERIAQRNITIDRLIEAARRILHPYVLEVKEVAWWSVYEIGQRLCDKFDDVSDAEVTSCTPRIFIAGDACHTHSPKAGQGMNVSMQDAFNLGWKLAAVIEGRSLPVTLHTYSAERRTIAKELIDFDREFAKMFSAVPKRADDEDGNGADPAEFQRYFTQQGRFTAGTATHYGPSILSAESSHQHLARGFVVGTRFHSAPVIRLADARPMQLGHTLKADGRWRLVLFADAANPESPGSALNALCRFLNDSPQSIIARLTPPGADIDAIFDVRVVFQQGHRQLALEAMPELLLPRKGRYGLIDYEKMFCPDVGAGDIFDLRGVSREGCVVIVRPDQYVAHVLPLDATTEIAAFFDAFMLVPSLQRKGRLAEFDAPVR